MMSDPHPLVPADTVCEVRICFFKPSGYEDRHWVKTHDRGKAALAVMALEKYNGAQMFCLNYIEVRHTSPQEGRPIMELP